MRALAGLACAFALVTTSRAAAPFKFPSGQLHNQPLKAEKSVKGHKLTAHRPTSAAIHRKGPKEMPATYHRPQKGNQKPSARPAPYRYGIAGGAKPVRVDDRWSATRLAADRNLLPDRRKSAPY